MREGSPNQFPLTDSLYGDQPRSKSLFQNILSISPFESRFYADSRRYPIPKFLRMNILRTGTKKMWEQAGGV